MNDKTMILLRGVSGSGKTTFAETLCTLFGLPTVSIMTADDYFIGLDGSYNFDASKLYLAHQWCREGVETACKNEDRAVIVANTSCREEDVNAYKNIADFYGYTFVSLIVENRHGNKNVHDVPQDALDRQETQLFNSIKLR